MNRIAWPSKSKSSSHIWCIYLIIPHRTILFGNRSSRSCKCETFARSMPFWCVSLARRRELQTAQNENFQLEKKIHELQVSIQSPGMANRMSDMGNGLAMGASAPPTPNVVRKYYEMKYGDKTTTAGLAPTGNASSSMFNHTPSFDGAQTPMNPMTARNGAGPSKGPSSSVPPPNVTMGARSNTFKFPTKLPDSIQTTLTNTSQTLQSKLPASLQKLPASFTQGQTMNMLASKFQNAFS